MRKMPRTGRARNVENIGQSFQGLLEHHELWSLNQKSAFNKWLNSRNNIGDLCPEENIAGNN